MSKMIIVENEHVTLWFHPVHKIIHHKFHLWLRGSKFREALDTGCEMLKKQDARKWLSDDRNNAALAQEDVAWCRNDWFPRSVQAGLKYWAIVLPELTVGKMDLAGFIKGHSDKGVTVQVFTHPEEALKWLEKQ